MLFVTKKKKKYVHASCKNDITVKYSSIVEKATNYDWFEFTIFKSVIKRLIKL
jgi:hypothetical protein